MAWQIVALYLENFKAYRGKHRLRLGVQPGLYYVTGVNRVEPDLGANGAAKSTLFDALYWCLTGRTLRTTRPGAAVESWGDKAHASVAVELLTDDGAVVVERTRRPNTLTLDRKGKKQTVEQPAIDKLLGLSADALKRTLIIAQFGELFLDLRPEAQSQMFTEVLNLDLWLHAADLAGKEARQYTKDLEHWQRQHDVRAGQLAEIRDQLKRERRASGEFNEKNAAALADAKAALAKLEKSARQAPAKPALRVGADKAALDKAEDRLRALEARRRVQADAASSLTAELRGAERQQQELSAERQRYAKADGTCPECGQQVTTKHLTRKLAAVDKRLDAAQQQLDDLAERLRAAKAARDDHDDDIDKLKRQIKQDRDRLWQEQEEAAKAERVRLALENDIKRCQERIADLKQQENPYGKIIANLKKREDEFADDHEKAEKEVAAFERLLAQAEYWSGAFKEIRLSLIDETILELELASNRHAEGLGLHGWQIKFATERESKQGSVSAQFTTLIYPPGADDPIAWESYSGGESQRWQLAVTFGLSEVLLARAGLSPNIEVLDEPTQHLSQTGIDDLLEHLRSRALELRRAIYFVDHRSLDRGAFDGVLLVEKDDKGARIVQQP